MTDKKSPRDADTACFSVRLDAVVRKDKPGIYEVFCPVFDLWSQGDTIAEAKKNIAEAVVLFMETCYEQGTLNRVLLESFPKSKQQKRKKRGGKLGGDWDKRFRFSAKVALVAV